MNVLKTRFVETSKYQNWGQMEVYRPQNLAPRVEFCVESESEVKNAEFRAPGAKNWKKRPQKKNRAGGTDYVTTRAPPAPPMRDFHD